MQWTGAYRVMFGLVLVFGAGIGSARGQSLLSDEFRVLFPHFASGDGFSTVFTLMNSGATTADGFLTMYNANGLPRTPLQLRIPPGGIASYTVGRPTAIQSSGWAKYEGSGGEVTGVATFQLGGPDSRLLSIAGVLSTQPAQHLRIPAEIRFEGGSYSGYAIANPGDSAITVRLNAFDPDGIAVGEVSRLTLLPGQQIARFLHEDLPGVDDFAGSVVLSSDDAPFIAISLVQVQGLYTAVPGVSKSIP